VKITDKADRNIITLNLKKSKIMGGVGLYTAQATAKRKKA